jgi:hypothetical protein|tara:strand:- start:6471 stop:7610 length:1140 start_codon:yes stop_codon:yes gene_type:complete
MSNPTFGYLASLVTPLKTRVALHTADAGKVVEGKLVITHKDPYPVRVRIGVSTGGVLDFNPENYILYDYEIGEGESYESDTIYYGNNQTLVVWSTCASTTFVLHGQIKTDPTDTGFVAAAMLNPVKTNKTIYSVPTGEEALLSLFVANQSSSNARFRIAIVDSSVAPTVTSDQYIEYNQDLLPRVSYQRKDIKVRGDQSIIAYSDNPDVSISVYAKFNYSVVDTDFTIGGQLTVGGAAILQDTLEVRQTATLKETLNAEKEVTIGTDAVPANLTVKGDVAVGSVSIAQSTGNISTPGLLTANTIATSGDIVAGSNKVVLDGATGDINMQGQLTVAGGFGGDLNLLNNKVTNLADPAAATDAANRKYVDSKVVAFSIALG